MAGNVFAALDSEEQIQVLDATRLDASKSFVSPVGSTALTALTITPGLDGAAQSVFSSSDAQSQYLDWVFNTWTFDIVAGFNDKIDFSQGSTVCVATLTPGTYTLATLCTLIGAQMTAATSASGTFTASADELDKITIANDTTNFKLLPTGVSRATSILPHVGFKEDIEGLDVTGKRVEYSHKKILISATNGTAATLIKFMKVFSVGGDALFSSDGDLQTWEPDILKYVKAGRVSWLNVHREAQKQIMYYLDKNGYVNAYAKKYTKFDILDISEVNEWSTFVALSVICWSISNKEDDVWLKKHYEFKTKYAEARDRAVLRLDTNEDGIADVGEQIGILSGTVVVR